jgi:hypothetical protein
MALTYFVLLFVTGFLDQTPRPVPCSAPEHRQFDFWIGEWEVKTPDGKVAGTNRIERVEGGCALQENWTGAGNTGRSLNAYWPGDRKWHQFWIGSGGLVMHLSGVFKGDALRLEGVVPLADGRSIQHRLTFTKRADGTVRQFWENSADAGKTWTVAFDGLYTRIRAGVVAGASAPPA